MWDHQRTARHSRLNRHSADDFISVHLGYRAKSECPLLAQDLPLEKLRGNGGKVPKLANVSMNSLCESNMISAALRATRSMRCAHQAVSLGPSGNDRERYQNERDFLRTHSFPLRSLRVRGLLADPLARLHLSLSCGRRTRIRFGCRCCTVGATACRRFCLPPRRPPASRFARVPFLFRPLHGNVYSMIVD
jgi:hypothetical protein